jgi:hypothetical protein
MAAIVKIIVSALALAWISTQALASPLPHPGSEVGVIAGRIVLADLKCGLVNGKLVCGTTKDHKNRDDDDDDDDDDRDDHKHKDKKESKGKKDKPELTECTIQGPNSGGGCKTGFTRVCEKMKSGKKCCGCVADKTAPAPAEEKLEDNPCFTHCSTKCGGSGDAQKSCLIECLQTTSCRPPE